ncbi:MAG: metal ABC transporter solute-binding protein, Zn/Mn family [Pseudomonadales bacterium]
MYLKACGVTLLDKPMTRRYVCFWLSVVCALALCPAQAGPRVQVLSSVKPVHLVVGALAGDIIDSKLLLSAQISPHDFALRFSDLRLLQQASVIVWLGPQFEHYLVEPLQQRDRKKIVSLLADHETSDKHSHDPHIWLDPLAVKDSAERIAAALIAADPGNAGSYRDKLAVFQAQLDRLHQRIAARFEALEGSGVITTHAGLQHFLQRYQLNQAGSVYAGANELLSLKHIEGLRRRVVRGEAHCVMLEPQYERSKIQALFKGLDINLVEVDVLGANATSYVALLNEVSDAVYRCVVEKTPGAHKGSGNHRASVK